ncbi:glycosyltransferase family 39 protein [Actinacidiphila glaucinigra]|uniref:glycosyltransferase family 39 protein n=1 Tax=Actinacidiphila glaucinigra TaxID=235986 RepID=UPI002E35BD49|nr:glycosyltransferase family 39 protein [Actinacidiphila glaucinigra]
MSATHVRAQVAPFATAPVLGVAAAVAAVLTALSGRYGFHRDELYFLVAGDHPAWGYVDQPPLTPLAARLSTAVFGDTPAGLRVVATLACAVTVVTVAAVARELGGGRAAQVLAAACTAVSGFVLAVGHLVSTATFDMLAWVVVCWLLLRLLRTGDRRLWLALGAALGFGMQNKYLIALPALSLLVALLATGPRQVLRGWWPLAGAAVALAVALPSLWWQAAHGWPQLTVAGGISADDGAENRVLFVPQQIVFLSPVFVSVWIAGGLQLWRDPALRWARAFVPAYLLLAVVVVVSGGKPYYCLPLLLVLLAAGCVTSVSRPRAMWPAVALTAVISALISLPVLPPGVVGAVNGVNKEQGEQIGWPQLADAVAEAWSDVPAADRPRAVVFAQNYGEAGALAHYGPARGLPAPYSAHMSFADWGPPPDSATGPVLLVRQEDSDGVERRFTGCRRVGRVDNGQDVDNEEQHAAIVLCTGPNEPWSHLWPALRHYY